MNNRVLIVDDDASRVDLFRKNNPDWTIEWTADPSYAIFLIDTDKFDIICLDHDLGQTVNGNNVDIMAVVTHLRTNTNNTHNSFPPNDKTPILVHSMNPVGSNNICNDLRNHNGTVFKVPGGWGMPDLFNTILSNH